MNDNQKCEGCGAIGAADYVTVNLLNGGLCLCSQCLTEFNGKNPELRAAKERIKQLEFACAKAADEVCQTLGKALGYPYFKDDPVNFPDATEADGVCVGDHVAESIAAEAARRIDVLVKACRAAQAYDAAIQRRVVDGSVEIMATGGAVACGDDLDALYDAWITAANEALKALGGTDAVRPTDGTDSQP